MSLFFLGVIIAGLIFGSIAYNCFNKREIIEKGLRASIKNVEYNMSIIKQEAEAKVGQLSAELKKAKEDCRKGVSDIDLLNKDINSLKKQLEDCKKALADA